MVTRRWSHSKEKKFTVSNGKAYPGVTIRMVMGIEGAKEQQNPKELKIIYYSLVFANYSN
ncbi:MAG: hypothetical protein MR627_06285 [Prevotella sp.]|nr:hypothetical protein [Prevotella sp.]MDD6394505.1 hypothetical protein [Prevotella sp.]MDD6592288.1 hypothetical protein [Prevotella sp.]MDY2703123.1 hypothetical protein [Prevotella sp.]